MNTKYEPVIGLEIHLQLNTKSKMFSAASADVWQAAPNSKLTPTDLGLPGALPIPNQKAIKWTQRLGKALECQLNRESKFDRKNYFYPDLSKGYQISQFDQPLCGSGHLEIPISNGQSPHEKKTIRIRRIHDGSKKVIRIRRIHLEEDTGKSIHKNDHTYLDFNKSGMPLVELVTEPEFTSAEECSVFAKLIQQAARTLMISNAEMEKGNLRLEANISVRKVGQQQLPNYRVEIKNINSFKFMRDAINYEIDRQTQALEEGAVLSQETRGWNEKKNITFLQRSKEEAHDYRYFPEPDIPPLVFDDQYFNKVLQDLPKMPWEVEKDLINTGIRAEYAEAIATHPDKLAAYQHWHSRADSKVNDLDEIVKVIINTKGQDQIERKIQDLQSKDKESGLSDNDLDNVVNQIIQANPAAVADYKAGKENAIKFLVGQIMKETQGRASPQESESRLYTKIQV